MDIFYLLNIGKKKPEELSIKFISLALAEKRRPNCAEKEIQF